MDISPVPQTPHRSPSEQCSPSNSSTEEPSNSDPIARLDALLTTYLDRLDTYQKLREDLSKNLSSGFLSLAHANRTINLGSGRRYGEDGYDERMKAGRRVEIEIRPKAEGDTKRRESQQEDVVGSAGQAIPDPDSVSHQETMVYKIVEHKPASDVDVDSNDQPTQTSPPEERKREQALPPYTSNSLPPTDANPTPKPADSATTTIRQSQPKAKPPKRCNPNPNPLHWYGILTPPSLRQAQQSFTSAVSEQMASLLNLGSEMRDLESQIRQLRKEAGLVGGGERTVPSEEDGDDEQESKFLSARSNVPKSTSTSTSTRKHLSSRPKKKNQPKEPPRSRVLKLE